MMKSRRSVWIALVVILIIIGGGIYYVLTNINAIVEGAIEKYGSRVVGTSVEVASVDINLRAGEGSLSGFRIANPPGFPSSHAFRMDNIRIRLDTGTLRGDPLVIEEIKVSAPEVRYDINESGTGNLNTLKNNIQSSGTSSEEVGDSKATGRKLRIRRLVIDQGLIELSVPVIEDSTLTIRLPGIELTDVGGAGGELPNRIAEDVLQVLVERSIRAAASMGVERYLGKSLEEMRNEIEKQSGEKIQEMIGESVESAEGKVRDLLGK